MCLSERGLVEAVMRLSGRGLVIGSYVAFRVGVDGRQLCAFLVGDGRQLCAFVVGGLW
jgi:hypothetical protein